MIKKYFSSSDIRLLKEQSMVMFQEVSEGVYFVVKDRYGMYPSYVTSLKVADALNNKEQISVSHSNETTGYANFELVKHSR